MKRIKAEDFIGETFGELTIQNVIKKNNRSYCICKCSCGNITEVVFSNLRIRNTTSCGNRKIHPRVKKENLIGQRFNKLLVLKDTGKKSNSHTIWQCQCDCGNIIEVRGDYLKSGHTFSCGCIMSKGEEKIIKILTKNNIHFITQKTFDDLIYPSGYPARFDFYVANKYLIEYDGIQHFEEGNFLNNNKKYDIIKNNYCKNKKIPLIRIPYYIYNDLKLEDLLLETTKFLLKGDETYNAE